MKHYTTIEQSKKFLELGLNPETADMAHIVKRNDCREPWELAAEDSGNVYTGLKDSVTMCLSDYAIPCWSLGALLEIMPKEITDKDGIVYKLLLDVKDGFPKYYSDSYEIYHGDFPYPTRDEGKSLFDYLVEGVFWLLENGFIKRN